jgi:hypothetical protein
MKNFLLSPYEVKMDTKTIIQDMIDTLTQSLSDADRFDRGQDKAGQRLRSTASDISKKLKTLRIDIQTERASRKEAKQKD